MTILVAYAPRPEGEAAFEKAIEMARQNKERLVVVNASEGGHHEDPSRAFPWDIERLEQNLKDAGVEGEVLQFVRGIGPVEEINELVDSLPASLLIIGLRRRSAVGKLLLGSVAQELLLSVSCPVLAVKSA